MRKGTKIQSQHFPVTLEPVCQLINNEERTPRISMTMTLIVNTRISAKMESIYIRNEPSRVKNSREGRCVTRMFRGPILVDRMIGG